jgi:hypothetical protein
MNKLTETKKLLAATMCVHQLKFVGKLEATQTDMLNENKQCMLVNPSAALITNATM